MKIIVVANSKGGIGKSTTACALASILNKRGLKSLLIDADQQANSSDTYHTKIEGEATLYDVLLEDHIPVSEAVQHTEAGDIVAADPLLREADAKLSSDPEGLYRMANALEGLKGYDYVVIDTAPAINWTLRNCLISADEVIIPITADRYGVQGLSQLSETIAAIKKRNNNKLKIAGLLLVKYNPRTNLSKDVYETLEKIAKEMGTKLFETTIRDATKVKEAQTVRKNLIDYAEKSNVALDYEEFVNELIGEKRHGKK